jgi:hypothetical protein
MIKPTILINGCSHTEAMIANRNGLLDPLKYSWPNVLSKKLDADVINIGVRAKDNFIMIEETIRYLLNYDSKKIDRIIIYFTDWERVSIYRKKASFTWEPNNIESQIERIDENKYYTKYGRKIEFHKPWYSILSRIIKTTNSSIRFGDESLVHQIITTGTLLYCLYNMCLSKNIKLNIINWEPFLSNTKTDPVWQKIPNNLFLIKNNHESSIFYHFSHYFDMPDGSHFDRDFHDALADYLKDFILNNTQIDSHLTIPPKKCITYDYTVKV